MSGTVTIALVGVSLLVMLLLYVAMVRFVPEALATEDPTDDEGHPA
jgi:hypothetical protein